MLRLFARRENRGVSQSFGFYVNCDSKPDLKSFMCCATQDVILWINIISGDMEACFWFDFAYECFWKCWHSPPGVPFLAQYMSEVLAQSRCAVPWTVHVWSAGTVQVCRSLHSTCLKCWHSPPGVPFLAQYMSEVLAQSSCAVPCTVQMFHETKTVMCFVATCRSFKTNTLFWYKVMLCASYCLLTVLIRMFITKLIPLYPTIEASPSGRAVLGVGLRPLACWDCGFMWGMDVCLWRVLYIVR